ANEVDITRQAPEPELAQQRIDPADEREGKRENNEPPEQGCSLLVIILREAGSVRAAPAPPGEGKFAPARSRDVAAASPLVAEGCGEGARSRLASGVSPHASPSTGGPLDRFVHLA